MRYLITLLFLSIFTSCASIFTSKINQINFTASAPDTVITILDETYTLPNQIEIEKSKSPLIIRATNDSITRNFVVKAKPNGAFLAGNLIFTSLSPIAYIIDFTNTKRFTYGKEVYIDFNANDSIIKHKILSKYLSKEFPAKKGDLNLIFSLPWLNDFVYRPFNENTKKDSGYIGFSLGLERYYKDKKFLSLEVSYNQNYFYLFPFFDRYNREQEYFNTFHLSLTDNIKLKRFSVGYGLNLSQNKYEVYDLDRKINKSNTSIGITLNGYNRIYEGIHIGVIYRPTLLTIKPTTDFKYEHLISLDLKFRIPLRKNK